MDQHGPCGRAKPSGGRRGKIRPWPRRHGWLLLQIAALVAVVFISVALLGGAFPHGMSGMPQGLATSKEQGRMPLSMQGGHHPKSEMEGGFFCESLRGSGLYNQVARDFAPLQRLPTGEGERLLMEAERRCRRQAYGCFVLEVRNGSGFIIADYPGFQSRNKATQQLIFRVLQKFGMVLPDTRIVVDTTDGCGSSYCHRQWTPYYNFSEPIFVITKPKGVGMEILYPDFTFQAFPESICAGEMTHAWAWLYKASAEFRKLPWQRKKDVLFWRGAATGGVDRLRVLSGPLNMSNLSPADAKYFDIGFMEWYTYTLRDGGVANSKCTRLLDACNHRYLAHLKGNTYSSRLKYLLMCGATVVMESQDWLEYWYPMLVPGKHYVEVQNGFMDVAEMLSSIRRDTARAQSIAETGASLIENLLSPAAVDCYWRELLISAGDLLRAEQHSIAGRAIEDWILQPIQEKLAAPTRQPPPPLPQEFKRLPGYDIPGYGYRRAVGLWNAAQCAAVCIAEGGETTHTSPNKTSLFRAASGLRSSETPRCAAIKWSPSLEDCHLYDVSQCHCLGWDAQGGFSGGAFSCPVAQYLDYELIVRLIQ